MNRVDLLWEITMVRLTAALGVLLAGVVPSALAQSGLEPGVRMGAMRNALDKAKTLKIGFTAELDAKKGKGDVKGTILLGQDEKVRMELDMTFNGKSQGIITVADGKTMRTRQPSGDIKSQPARKNMRMNIVTMLERVGIAYPLLSLRSSDEKDPDLKKELTLSNAKFKENEKNIYKCTYTLATKDAKFDVELWLDGKSNLPIRRVLRAEKEDQTVTITETYTVELNPKLMDDAFTLPEAK